MALTKKELCDFLMKERTKAKDNIKKEKPYQNFDLKTFYEGQAAALGKVLEFVQKYM